MRLSKSIIERGTANRIDGNKYAEKLRALDKNGDGELDLEEVVDAMEQMIKSEKQNRMLKWFLAAMTVFCLLTIAATVGLTYAVVSLSKDTKVGSDNALVNKNTGETLKTGANIQSLDPFTLSQTLNTTDAGNFLARLESIKVPGNASDEAYTVHRVASASLLTNNAGIRVRTANGDVINFYTMAAPPTEVGTGGSVAAIDEVLELEGGARRRLAAFKYPTAANCAPFGRTTKPKTNNTSGQGSGRKLLGQFETYTFTQESCDALKASLVTECGASAYYVHTFNALAALEILKLQIDNPTITLSDSLVTPYLQDICFTDAKELKGNAKCLAWEKANLGAYAACLSLYDMYTQ